jgi:hypothetical protein
MQDMQNGNKMPVPIQAVPWYKNVPQRIKNSLFYHDTVVDDEDAEWDVSHSVLSQRALLKRYLLVLLTIFTIPTSYHYLTTNLGVIYGQFWAIAPLAFLEGSVAFWAHAWHKLSENIQQRNAARFMCYASVGTVLSIFYDSTAPYTGLPTLILGYLPAVLFGFVLLTFLVGVYYVSNYPDNRARAKRMERDGVAPDSSVEVRKRVGVEAKRVLITPEQWTIIQANPNNAEVAEELGKSLRWVQVARKQGIV